MGKMIQFDYYFWDGLKPPTSYPRSVLYHTFPPKFELPRPFLPPGSSLVSWHKVVISPMAMDEVETTVDLMSLGQFDWWLYNDSCFTIMMLRRSVIMRNRYTNYNIHNCGGWIPTCYWPTSFHMLTSCSHFQYPWSRLATCHTLYIYVHI